ncbi:hypothetical protein B0H10DRAFT_216761 [Mycena sp. CBHHK59/15]|nr:hypothetical protein B0H10DRAFT_216761 [Mycena sp. CBHHK59/15]
MAKRKRVPQALHSELSEYSSLLRALRTNDILDVAKHITGPPPPKERRKPKRTELPVQLDVGELRSSLPDESDIQPVAGPSNLKEIEAPKRKHARKRDTWTRWPLLVTDVHVPEWGLQDEIEALMGIALKNNPHAGLSESDSLEDLDVDDTPSTLPYLTQSASNFLSSVLALIAIHTPARPQSMQDRINPIGWQNVLDVVGSCGDSRFDENMINNVRARMEAIYVPYESNALDRMPIRIATKSKAAATLENLDRSLLTFPPEPQARQMKRKKTVIEDNVDSDDLDS